MTYVNKLGGNSVGSLTADELAAQGFVLGSDGKTFTRTSTQRGGYGSINSIGGGSDYSTGNRYLSTVGNHISGESASANDQFMRVNAFLGSADLSMILHMLAQRSDTDLLSAPKVVTKSGENAVIKVVTEYIYPQDYDVQLQSSSSGSSGGSSGGGQSAILAVVEPQNFTMREVGVILDVTPTYSEANGGTIDLELKPQVVDEPIWKNYGMRIPFTGNTSSGTMADIGNIFTGMSTALEQIGAPLTSEVKNEMANEIMDSALISARNVSSSSSSTMTWYDAPMEQPFFHVRSIDSKVSITPGSTVVMGGLITEARKAMDDKIPFLGDIPYIGRLFRSHAEQTVKRNLLIFVTGRLITPSGRELTMNTEPADEAEVKAAPEVK
jgi:general secretion pathway protein D